MATALAKQVAEANRRARRMGMAGTLTTLDWQRTLEAFGGCCAYCGEEPAATIDHFIPLAVGGATTQSNCVPSCLVCNCKSFYSVGENWIIQWAVKRARVERK